MIWLSDLPPTIEDLVTGAGPFGEVLNYGVAFIFVDSHFARRIRNALELTSHADQTTGAVALSLCVSALEALLCSGTVKKLEQLKWRIPAALHADQKLADDSVGAIRALYDQRSRCLHGERISNQGDMARDLPVVRRLVAAVLRAALEWAVQKNDGPERTDESEWRKELEAATKNPKQLGHIAGVTEDLAEHLRAFANVFGKDLIRELFDEADVEDVIVDRAKIIDYLLSETHENGRQKAAFFEGLVFAQRIGRNWLML
jgi:hypothetical protein